MRISAILLAAGGGNRFGGDIPKQFLRVAGEPILLRSLRAVTCAGVDEVVVVGHPSWMEQTRALTASFSTTVPITVIPGGETRNQSTWNALQSLSGDDDGIVLVHDAVRPLVSPESIRRAIEPVASGEAESADMVIPSADTLVVADGDRVIEIPDRARFRRGQTPQVFRRSVLLQAYQAAAAAADLTATDDCTLVLRHVPGARIAAVMGDETNVKITTRIDLVIADRMLQMRTLAAVDEAAPHDGLRGARLLVVGGTSGIGQAIADEAAAQGAISEVTGRSMGVDVRDAASVRECVDAAAERMGGLDHVVVTAGVLKVGRVADATFEELAEVIDVNLKGSLNVASAAYPHLRRTRGTLTFFASSSFTRGRPDYVTYSSSKAGVVNLAQGLAEEWSDDGIRVNAVSPERTDTPMRRQAFPAEEHAALLSSRDVAVATLRLVRSNLTGQVLDVRQHDVV
jgi:2-C-methyl-D-erythritol 4-phosphate cytidylyltransferase